MADNLTTFMCRLSWNLGALTSWNPNGLSRPVMGLLYLALLCFMGWMFMGSNPGRGKRFFSSPKRPDQLWVPSSLLFNEYRDSFSGLRRLEREVDHSPLFSVEVKYKWSYISTPPYMPSWRGQGQLYLLCYFNDDVSTAWCLKMATGRTIYQAVYLSFSHRLDPRPVRVGSVTGRVAMGHICSQHFRFFPVRISPPLFLTHLSITAAVWY
jgi:hypothetical protein